MQMLKSISSALVLALLVGSVACKKKEPEPPKPKTEASTTTQTTAQSTPASQASPNDEMTAQLKKVAGPDAKDCGTVAAKSGDLQSASDCALQSNDAKKPFWVRYELPLPGAQMHIATARASDGKLYTMQYSSAGYKQAPEGATISSDKKLLTMPCPDAPLRVAGSGRVTCFAPQQNAGNINASPHGGGMAMPGANPHGAMPPASGTNPHGASPPKPPATAKSHTM
jgi:hypothetical protein